MILVVSLSWTAQAVQERHGVLVGEVVKLDQGTKTAVIKLGDGTEHTLHFMGRTAVHGVQATESGGQDAFHGLKDGSQVAVHYTAKGSRETAEEVDNVGKDGLKTSDVTVTHIDRGAKTMAVKTADGSKETYQLTDRAAMDAGKDIGSGSKKSAKVTVYYTEEGGHKIAHFFKKTI